MADVVSMPAVSEHVRGSGSERFLGIQVLRGLSVVFTVMAHLPSATGPFAKVGLNAPWLIGVAIFYAISGWIIAHVTRDHTGADVAAFLTRRLFRIVPVLLVSVSMTLGFALTLPHMPLIDQFYPETPVALRAGFANLLFISDIGILIGIPAPFSLQGLWSIAVEVKFYLVYALLLVLAPWARSYGLLLLLALIAFTRWRLLVAGYPVATSHVFFLELFCAGGISYRFRDRFPRSSLLSILSWAWIFIFPAIDLQGGTFLIGYAGLLASVVYAVNTAAMTDIVGPGSLPRRWLIWLGERSYVLYVMHFQILAIAGMFAQLLGTVPSVYAWVLNASIFLGLPVVELIHQTIEKGGIRAGARIANAIKA